MAALAAGDYTVIQQFIEGNRMANLQWGTANAKPAVFRCASACASSPAGGRKFCVVIRNYPPTYSIVYNLLTSQNALTWTEHTLVIPPPTVGTWATDNTAGLSILFSIACGTTYQTATTGSWVAGNFLGTSQIGSYPTSAQGVYITEVGLYADPNNTGIAPSWEYQPDNLVMRDCLRYWHKCYTAVGIAQASTATPSRATYPNQAVMRVAPAGAITGALTTWDQATQPNLTALTTSYLNPNYDEWDLASSAAQNAGRASIILGGSAANYIAINARM